jgi:protoheme IX farnesyltransferase
MVLVTAAWGYFLAAYGSFDWSVFLFMMMGVGLSAAGGAVLNNYLERDLDRLMKRTCRRALPMGEIKPLQALLFGLYLIMIGEAFLLWKVNLLTAFLVLFSNFLYVLVYTPMKRLSSLNTTVGAIPGAIPPLAGWTAATGQADIGGLVLFALLFVWQHPHFYAIAWMYREDYERAGFKMLTQGDESGLRTALFTVFGTMVLINVSVLPVVFGLSSMVYLVAALTLGVGFLAVSWLMARSRSYQDARRVLKASVIYLPLLLVVTIIDKLV